MTEQSLIGKPVVTDTQDPRRGMTSAEISAMCKAYMAPGRSVREVAKSFRMSADRLRAVVVAEGCQLRGRDFAVRQSRSRMGKRSIGHVFGGLAKDQYVQGPAELEQAKLTLRRRGRIVFDATVDGSGPKGMVKCDGKLFTAEQIIQWAST